MQNWNKKSLIAGVNNRHSMHHAVATTIHPVETILPIRQVKKPPDLNVHWEPGMTALKLADDFGYVVTRQYVDSTTKQVRTIQNVIQTNDEE